MFFNKGFTSFCLCWVKRVDLGNFEDKVRAEFNGMIIGVMRREMVMGFLREDICKVFTPLWDEWFHWLGGLGDLGRDGGLIDLFPLQPSLLLV